MFTTPSPSAAPIVSSEDTAKVAPSSGTGICYSPYKADGSCKSASEVMTDLSALASYSTIRIYGTDCNQVSTVLAAAKVHNFKIFAGVFDITQAAAETSTLISAVAGDWSYITTVSIGNEQVNSGTSTPSAVIAAVTAAKTQLKAAGYTGPVVTVDTFNALIAHPELCTASDYCAANCHAFFDPNTAAPGAGAFCAKQAAAVSAAAGGKKTIITESGWPTAGESNGAAVPSESNQKTAMASLDASLGDFFAFSAYNDKWKKNFQGSFGAEQNWGLLGDSSTS